MSPLRLYNTASRTIEVFKPTKKIVGLYTCGPTVYNYQHIGNLRSMTFADIAYRVLKQNGHKVQWVMNITDIDDKTIRSTVALQGTTATIKDLRAYTTKYLNIFLSDLDRLNISRRSIRFIRVLDVISAIKRFVKKLVKKGYGYASADGTYFTIAKYEEDFKDYGRLVGEGFLAGKKMGARVKVDEYEKENLSDFALWKHRAPEDGNIFWKDKELGEGRPGWHIECSVVNSEAFGLHTTDIHTGGVDLIFPHHTNEIAQSQPLYKPFVKYWLHGEHLLVNDEKMAKSKGNFFTLRDIQEKGFHPLAFRYLMLGAHYRSKINFTWDSVKAAEEGLENLYREIYALPRGGTISKKEMGSYENRFMEAINDDLNTPKGLAVLWETIKDKSLSPISKHALIKTFDNVLGLGLKNPTKSLPTPRNIQVLCRKYEQFRSNEQFVQSDALRKELDALGYVVEDTSAGSRLLPKSLLTAYATTNKAGNHKTSSAKS